MMFARRVLPSLVCIALSLPGAGAAEPKVTVTEAPGLIGIRIDDQPFAVFNHSPGLAKPYLFPLRAPGNHVVNALAPFDHKHHKGIWVGVEHVNGNNFWGAAYQQQDAVTPGPARERIETVETNVTAGPAGSMTLNIHNVWQGEEGKPVAHEKTAITVFPNRLMVYDISLSPADGPVSFEDTKEGFLAIRVAPSMNGKTGGVIVNADGELGEENCWGKTSPWVDYSGPVDGKTVGVALFDHPGNFRKSRYHVRAYGLFAISPFGEKVYSKGQSEAAPVKLQPGDTLRLKYGVFPHAGDAEKGGVADAYAKFVEWTK